MFLVEGARMSESEQIKALLDRVIAALELLSKETAELVYTFHSPRTANHALSTVSDRANALTEATQKLRQDVDVLLGKSPVLEFDNDGFQKEVSR
jgi:hypothetical protein